MDVLVNDWTVEEPILLAEIEVDWLAEIEAVLLAEIPVDWLAEIEAVLLAEIPVDWLAEIEAVLLAETPVDLLAEIPVDLLARILDFFVVVVRFDVVVVAFPETLPVEVTFPVDLAVDVTLPDDLTDDLPVEVGAMRRVVCGALTVFVMVRGPEGQQKVPVFPRAAPFGHTGHR